MIGDVSISMSLPCGHAIAYRKKNCVAGPLISWNCIHERWTTPAKQLNKVRPFAYERLDSSGDKKGFKPGRSEAERY